MNATATQIAVKHDTGHAPLDKEGGDAQRPLLELPPRPGGAGVRVRGLVQRLLAFAGFRQLLVNHGPVRQATSQGAYFNATSKSTSRYRTR